GLSRRYDLKTLVSSYLFTISSFCSNRDIAPCHLDSELMKSRTPRRVIRQVILLSEFGADLFEHRGDRILLRNVQCASTADRRERLERVRVDQDGRTNSNEVQKHGGTLSFFHDMPVADRAAVVTTVCKNNESFSWPLRFFDLCDAVLQAVK